MNIQVIKYGQHYIKKMNLKLYKGETVATYELTNDLNEAQRFKYQSAAKFLSYFENPKQFKTVSKKDEKHILYKKSKIW